MFTYNVRLVPADSFAESMIRGFLGFQTSSISSSSLLNMSIESEGSKSSCHVALVSTRLDRTFAAFNDSYRRSQDIRQTRNSGKYHRTISDGAMVPACASSSKVSASSDTNAEYSALVLSAMRFLETKLTMNSTKDSSLTPKNSSSTSSAASRSFPTSSGDSAASSSFLSVILTGLSPNEAMNSFCSAFRSRSAASSSLSWASSRSSSDFFLLRNAR
ncbi:hypothetical protein OGAPHI_002680 [Ogataea philodendri]|uniref:Uncharacterized protein n=1 Tax=Ogataea philodendri TaxID=1378263 RepID=A0A9P8PC16_9ASCO|nr:uncharacterized protein OGAPHI_002680 [Ogataea philodendri]KAH3668925.1 hypothetical protein OGAPHI_002680 [Ogataea philodendri]